VKNNLHSVF